MMDKFTQLVADLKSGELGINHIAIALSVYYRDAEHLPEGVRNIIGGVSEGNGIIHKHFNILQSTIGAIELAYRRGDSP